MHRPLNRLLPALLLLPLLLLTYWVYSPGLTGQFLFDDLIHLPRLGQYGGVHDLPNALRFLFDWHQAGSSRFLGMATFLLNAQDWPASAGPFLHTNILFHLLAGTALFALARILFRLVAGEGPAKEWLALLCAALWLLHPLNTSTTLYIIQRLTQVGAILLLFGLILYLKGRLALLTRPRRGAVLMVTGLFLFGALAALSKEIGILIFVYAAVLEATLLHSVSPERFKPWSNRIALVLFAGPVAFMVLYYFTQIEFLSARWTIRDFDMWERVLTEQRILLDYLGNILIPRSQGMGLYQDDFAISRSLLHPPATLAAIGVNLSLIVGALAVRGRYPVIAFGVLWFYGGHILESSFLPLELYFEHRNYLPSIGPIFAGIYLLYRGFLHFRPHLRPWVAAAAVTFPLALAFMTHSNARLWGHPLDFALVLAAEHPESIRAQTLLADTLYRAGAVEGSLEVLERVQKENPTRFVPSLMEAYYRCEKGLPGIDMEALREAAPRARFDFGNFSMLIELKRSYLRNDCEGVDVQGLLALYTTLYGEGDATKETYSQALVHKEISQLYSMQGDYANTIRYIDLAYATFGHPEFLLQKAVYEAWAGRFEQAQALVDQAQEETPPNRFVAIDHQIRARKIREEIEDIRGTVEGRTDPLPDPAATD